MANVINSLKLGSGTYVFTTPYATCGTAADETAKVAATTPGSNFSLETGARITVKFTVTNTASNPTLNVNSTGAKDIYYRGSAISAGYLAANRTYEFVYNGTQYELVGDINTDANTTTTTGASNTSNKIFLVGAETQAPYMVTYTHDTVYIGTDGCLNVRSADSDNERMIVAGTSIKKVTPVGTYEYGFPSLASGNSATIALTSDIPDVSNFVTPNVLNASLGNYVDISSAQEISGKKTFTGGVQFGTGTVFNNGGIQIPAANAFKVMGMYDVSLPSKTGTLALTSDIPSGGGGGDVTLAGNNTFTGNNTFKGGTTSFMTARSGPNDPITTVDANGVLCKTSSDPGTYYKDTEIKHKNFTLTLPFKSGVLATTDDIPSTSSFVTTDTEQTISGIKTFTSGGIVASMTTLGKTMKVSYNSNGIAYTPYGETNSKLISFPAKGGTFALTSDIPIKSATLSGTTLSITLS